ncbi:MAG TPA: DEAD/DEAH box helicase [Solirubrobacteraceae bacterium]|nr:DEAD/DEAH box helicase [Solirubrobacteraceae bacterium]
MSHDALSATLADEQAVLRFPYDERLRQLLRAIPGRRWDPVQRAWCLPLGPEQAEALTRLLGCLPQPPRVSEALARALARRRTRRRLDECLLELARPDERWWLSFATDAAPEAVAALLEHPEAREVPAIGRALLPLDERGCELARALARRGRVRLSEAARRALEERARRALGAPAEADGGRAPASVDPRVSAWLTRARTWRGSLEVGGPGDAPLFLLLGDERRLPRALRELATSVPGGATVPLTLRSWRLIEGLEPWLGAAARRCVAALEEGRPAPAAVLELAGEQDDRMFVLVEGHDPARVREFAALRGTLQDAGRRAIARGGAPRAVAGGEHERPPAIRADPFCVPQLDRFLADGEVWVAPDALELLQEIRERHAHAAGLVELSAATDASLRVVGLGGELKPFQRAGVSYLLACRRAFLADEQGLGKTIEALAALEAAGAYPAVVVCPASLKLNWRRELERWLPARSVRVLSGNRAQTGPACADVTVLNYEIVAARLPELRAPAPRALVLDESHYCKNAAAKRTQAVQRLSAAVPRDGLVLALSGTPVTNRPAELISQLRILGRLHDFGSGASFGARFSGGDAHLRLHWHLRARCFVRRLKADVLPQLPAKTRAVVPVELDNEAEYRLAERDLVAWLRSQPLDLRELDARVAAALRAERLVRCNALKLLAARGKLHAALAWIHDFCCSGERLIVFASHREIQRAVLARFPHALHILGEDSAGARDAALAAFQAPCDAQRNQLIVCSIDVAGQGLTLTRASHVAFLELGWTPAKHDQAEDRCHRIGQQDAVSAYYLLAAGTIDETISTLLERKRAVIGAVTDGREHDEEGVLEGLVRELRGAPYRHLRAVA